MRVAVGRGMDVQVDEPRASRGVRKFQTGLFLRLTMSGIRGSFADVDVPPWLHPAPEAPVHVQHRPTRTYHDSGPRHVDRVGILVEGALQGVQSSQDPLSRRSFALVGRKVSGYLRTYVAAAP
jgi:hypothetical protein